MSQQRFSPDVRDNADMTPLHLAAKFAQWYAGLLDVILL